MEEIGVFICEIREKLLNCSPINSIDDRKLSSLFTICLILVDNNCEKESLFSL